VRAIADHPTAFRGAASGPYYVEFEGQPRISRQAAQYFLDQVYQRARQLKLPDPGQQRAWLTQQRASRDFWQQRRDQATVD
jgi:hypothetical protein